MTTGCVYKVDIDNLKNIEKKRIPDPPKKLPTGSVVILLNNLT